MTPEDRCRILCRTSKIDPYSDAPESYQNAPGPRAEDGRVKNWHMWLTAVNSRLQPENGDAEKKMCRDYLQKIVEETKTCSPKFSCFEENLK